MPRDRLKEEGRPAGSGKGPGRSCGGSHSPCEGLGSSLCSFSLQPGSPPTSLAPRKHCSLHAVFSPHLCAHGRQGQECPGLRTAADIQGSTFTSERSSALWGGTCGVREVVGMKSRGSFSLLKTQAGLGEADWRASTPQSELDLQASPLRVPGGSSPPPTDCPQG